VDPVQVDPTFFVNSFLVSFWNMVPQLLHWLPFALLLLILVWLYSKVMDFINYLFRLRSPSLDQLRPNKRR
jgi:hypothetical protein